MANKLRLMMLSASAALLLAACTTTASTVEPLAPGQARIICADGVAVKLSAQGEKAEFVRTLTVDPGDVEVSFQLSVPQAGGAITAYLSGRHIKKCTLKMEADHVYVAKQSNEQAIQAFWNRPIIVTDTATNSVVAKVENAKEPH